MSTQLPAREAVFRRSSWANTVDRTGRGSVPNPAFPARNVAVWYQTPTRASAQARRSAGVGGELAQQVEHARRGP